jgi:hypothetical protein
MAPENKPLIQAFFDAYIKKSRLQTHIGAMLILRREAMHQKEITIINLYTSKVSTPNFIKHTLKY